MAKRKVLFIGLVWPEPTSSAAGTRIIQLVNLFLAKGDEVHFASAAQKSTYSFPLKKLGVEEHSIQLNESSFDLWIKELNPNIIVFDTPAWVNVTATLIALSADPFINESL